MGPYSGTLAYVYRMFIFHSNLIQLFFNLFNWLDRKLFVECLQISSLSYGFGDQLNKTDFVLQIDHLYELQMDHIIFCYFILKGAQFRNIVYLEGILNISNSKIIQMSNIQQVQHITMSNTLLCQAKYCFHTRFLIYTCRTFPFRHAAVVSWFALRSSYYISVNNISTFIMDVSFICG